MELSARNQLHGTVRSVTLGNVMAEVVVDVNGQEIVSAITRGSAERLDHPRDSPSSSSNARSRS
jgi:molybdopterin-binding protein